MKTISAIIALFLSTCIPAQAADSLIIGYAIARTGLYASLSRSNEIAADMAIEALNESGGVNGKKLVLIKRDTGGDPNRATEAIRNFALEDNALCIVGPFSSSEAAQSFKTGEELQIVQMSMASAAPKLAARHSYAFRNTMDVGTKFAKLMETMKKKGYPLATAAVVHGTDDLIMKVMGTRILPSILKQSGVILTQTIAFRVKGTRDLSAQAAQLMRNPTAIVAVASPPGSATLLVKEMRRQGHKGRIVSGANLADPALPKMMGRDGDGTIIPVTFFSELNERKKKFTTAFRKRAKAKGFAQSEPSHYDAATYEIIQLYAEAIRRAKITGEAKMMTTERKAIRNALFGMKKVSVLGGSLFFGPDGDARKPVYVIEIQNRSWRLLETHPAE